MSQSLGRFLPIKVDAICIVRLQEQESVEIWASLDSYLSVSSKWRWIHLLWSRRVKHAFKELSSSYSLWNNEKEGNGGDVCLFYIAFRALVEQVRLPDFVFSLFTECFKLHWQGHLSLTCSLSRLLNQVFLAAEGHSFKRRNDEDMEHPITLWSWHSLTMSILLN